MKEAAKFTRDNPCTKVHLWNCFKGAGYRPVPVVVAKASIGDNAPKYLKKNGYLHESSVGGVDYYELTKEGRDWLEKGLKRHLELHPEDYAKCSPKVGAQPPMRRRASATVPKTGSSTVIRRRR